MTFSHYILRIYATLEYQENFLPAPENERSISSFRVILVQQALWLFRHGNFDVRDSSTTNKYSYDLLPPLYLQCIYWFSDASEGCPPAMTLCYAFITAIFGGRFNSGPRY